MARETAQRIAADDPGVLEIILFGSFVRDDYGPRSDIDLLVVVEHSGESPRKRLERYLRHVPAYPTDIFVRTRSELELALETKDPFLCQVMREGVRLYPLRG